MLFQRLRQVIASELPPESHEETEILVVFGQQMLEEIEMLCKCNKIRKISTREEQEEEKIDEEHTCNICCFAEKDTTMIPCGHQTCYNCIQVHRQNSEKCPYCNVVIQETRRA